MDMLFFHIKHTFNPLVNLIPHRYDIIITSVLAGSEEQTSNGYANERNGNEWG